MCFHLIPETFFPTFIPPFIHNVSVSLRIPHPPSMRQSTVGTTILAPSKAEKKPMHEFADVFVIIFLVYNWSSTDSSLELLDLRRRRPCSAHDIRVMAMLGGHSSFFRRFQSYQLHPYRSIGVAVGAEEGKDSYSFLDHCFAAQFLGYGASKYELFRKTSFTSRETRDRSSYSNVVSVVLMEKVMSGWFTKLSPSDQLCAATVSRSTPLMALVSTAPEDVAIVRPHTIIKG